MRILEATRQRANTKRIYGFDIETYDRNRKFLCASITDGKNTRFFRDKRECIGFLQDKRFRNSIMAATNLQFDFFGTFFNEPEEQLFDLLFSGSNLLSAKTWLSSSGYSMTKRLYPVTFIDTGNYAKLSVAQLGDIIGVRKRKTSVEDIIGKKPRNREEWDRMQTYNENDSLITQKAMQFLYDSFYALGATPKQTIAATSMSLFTNAFLGGKRYFPHPEPIILDIFRGYVGGNTHAYERGLIEDYNLYDFNSLYPSVMHDNAYPDPNTLRMNNINSIDHIQSFEGMSHVSVFCPDIEYPVLSIKLHGKTIMPTGTFDGWFSHNELRYAIKKGYVVRKVHTCYWYKETCRPFAEYVSYLYNKRLEHLKDNSPLEKVDKLLMNSLYGKFAQKFIGRENLVPFADHTIERLRKYDSFERIGNFLRVKVTRPPSAFCVPLWASYITAYGRIKLHEKIEESRPVYVDTDSIITKKKYPSKSGLGELKLEMRIKRGFIVRPKLYALANEHTERIKIRGLGMRLKTNDFIEFMNNPKRTYDKFLKIKEALIRKKVPNEMVSITKEFDLEDDKRVWKTPFTFSQKQHSIPIKLHNGIPINLNKETSFPEPHEHSAIRRPLVSGLRQINE